VALLDNYLQVILTRLTPCCQDSALFKVNKNILGIHSIDYDKENYFFIGEMHEGVVDLDSFLLLPTDCCCQRAVANRQLNCQHF
jgi:hypothetical protein